MNFPRCATWVMLGLVFLGGKPLWAQVAPVTKLVGVDGHRLNVRMAGDLRPGIPTVVFESGVGSLLQGWSRVQSEVSEVTRTVAYERAGIGASEPGTEPPTIKRTVTELHTLLKTLGAAPPYILVGHSYGGAITNMFAATFPGEVVGLVHVDPTDFMQNEADILTLIEKAGVKNPNEYLARSSIIPAAPPAGVSNAMFAELREVARAQQGGFGEFRSAGTAPDVPLVILLAAKRVPVPPAAAAAFPGDFARYRDAMLQQRIDHFGQLASHASNGTLVVTSRSGHLIHSTEPELVVWAIRRVLSLAK
jgi:pimeloyl-ACP methyl ester carboxylesterase